MNGVKSLLLLAACLPSVRHLYYQTTKLERFAIPVLFIVLPFAYQAVDWLM